MIDPAAEARALLDHYGKEPDATLDVTEAALAFARIDAPEEPLAPVRAHLATLAEEAAWLAEGLASGLAPETLGHARAAALADLLCARHGYRGDSETYDDPANANLIHVVNRRRGLPVALGVVWLHAARAAGWSAFGIDFPGHFVIALDGARSPVVTDVFAGGGVLDAPALRAMLKRIEGGEAELHPNHLRRMDGRAVLLRLQNNIKVRRLGARDLEGSLACVEDMLRLAPDHPMLWREAALMAERLDRPMAALRAYERLLALPVSAEVAAKARSAMAEIRMRLN